MIIRLLSHCEDLAKSSALTDVYFITLQEFIATTDKKTDSIATFRVERMRVHAT